MEMFEIYVEQRNGLLVNKAFYWVLTNFEVRNIHLKTKFRVYMYINLMLRL